MAKIKTNGIRPIHDHVLVTDLYFGEQKTKGGIIIRDDNGTARGVYPRWAKVYSKGPENNDDYNEGNYILIEHGRWTRGIEVVDPETGEETVIRKVDNENILMVSDEPMEDMAYSNVTGA